MRVDWILHAIVFAVLASIPIKMNWKRAGVLIVLPFLAELTQFLMPTRTPDIQDALVGASAVGIIVCLRYLYNDIAPVVRRYRRRRRNLGL